MVISDRSRLSFPSRLRARSSKWFLFMKKLLKKTVLLLTVALMVHVVFLSVLSVSHSPVVPPSEYSAKQMLPPRDYALAEVVPPREYALEQVLPPTTVSHKRVQAALAHVLTSGEQSRKLKQYRPETDSRVSANKVNVQEESFKMVLRRPFIFKNVPPPIRYEPISDELQHQENQTKVKTVVINSRAQSKNMPEQMDSFVLKPSLSQSHAKHKLLKKSLIEKNDQMLHVPIWGKVSDMLNDQAPPNNDLSMQQQQQGDPREPVEVHNLDSRTAEDWEANDDWSVDQFIHVPSKTKVSKH